MLGRAEARQAAPRREASLSAAGLKTGAQSRTDPPETRIDTEQAERPTDAAPKEPVTPRTSATAERKEQPSQDDTQNDQRSREDRRDERSTAANDAMMVAMNAPSPQAPLPVRSSGQTLPRRVLTRLRRDDEGRRRRRICIRAHNICAHRDECDAADRWTSNRPATLSHNEWFTTGHLTLRQRPETATVPCRCSGC